MPGKTEIHSWDIWWACVRFEDSEEWKRRPVLVTESGELYVLALFVTSHEARNMWGEYEIVKWKSAGLPKPSTIRITRPLQLLPDDLESKIGELQPIDIYNLLRMIG